MEEDRFVGLPAGLGQVFLRNLAAASKRRFRLHGFQRASGLEAYGKGDQAAAN